MGWNYPKLLKTILVLREQHSMNRRKFLNTGPYVAYAGLGLSHEIISAQASELTDTAKKIESFKPLLTPQDAFYDVSRGNPKPFTLKGKALDEARLTPESWRCEITADPFTEEPHTKVASKLEKPLTISDGTALDLPTLLSLGKKHEVHFLKAMQCLNLASPLGQGLWTGVPLREVLKLCGKMTDVRRIYFWGFHNNDPKQVFKSSLSYTQCMETPPGELPAFLAYRLNGNSLSLERGGPVRMIVPWSHGYKSIKWLNHIFVTNDPRNNDTYAHGNNDPDSYLKTAAYLDSTLEGKKFKVGDFVTVTGQVINGLSGLKRVEYWVRKVEGETKPLAEDAPELLEAPWKPCELQPEPDWKEILPKGAKPAQMLGFDQKKFKALSWPPRYGMCAFFVVIRGLTPGEYEIRARSIDLNGYAQPEPRPSQKSGKNSIQVRCIEVMQNT